MPGILSHLQKVVLAEALKRQGRIFNFEVVKIVYGHDTGATPWALNASRAAVSRSFTRLVRRGLVERKCGSFVSGIFLTERGFQLASKLVEGKSEEGVGAV